MKRVPPLVGKVQCWLNRLDFHAADMVVAVSGGPDSVALLRALRVLRPEGRFVIAHLNHQLRGAESDADETFVRALHAELVARGATRLELQCERADVAGRARQQRDNLENMARQVRYDWFTRIAQTSRARWIATGHTADDQAETVLHRLLRGTGLDGLRGIAARRKLTSEIEVIRPLLAVTRAEVLDYLRTEGQAYRCDSSNTDTDFTRNRIRQELLPHLAERYNPAIASLLCRLAEQAADAAHMQGAQADKLLITAELPRAGRVLVFDRRALMEAPRHLVRAALRLAWTREGWPLRAMSFDAWDRLAAVAFGEVVAVDMPGGIHASGRQQVMQLGQRA